MAEMPDPDGLAERLIGDLYDAALAPGSWIDVLRSIERALGGDVSTLFIQDRSHPSAAMQITAQNGYPDPFVDAYRTHYAALDLRIPAVAGLAAGGVYVDDRTLAFAQIARSPIYNDFYRPLGIGHAIGVNLFADGSRVGLLSVHRAIEKGGFTPAEIRLLERLSPHIRRAVQVQRQVARAEAAAVGLATTLDHFEMPVLLVGATGRVAVLNAAAEAFIARPGCPLSVRCQQLSATSASAADALRRTIALAAAATPSAPPDLLRLPAGLDGETVCIMAVPVRHERRSALSIPDADAQVLLFIASNEARLSIKPAVLVSQFGFTAAEADVAASLAAGETIDTIANRRGVSRETVRAQVKSIFGKTGVQSQSQLIASLASSIGALRFAR